jgi:hypothetical protein
LGDLIGRMIAEEVSLVVAVLARVTGSHYDVPVIGFIHPRTKGAP